jgi:hypothetical protein
MRARLVFLASAVVIVVVMFVWHLQSAKHHTESSVSATAASSGATSGTSLAMDAAGTSSESASTRVYAHNLLLRKGPGFRIYIPWFSGQMIRTRNDVIPTFDDPESFFLDVKTGIIHANIGDIGNFLNASGSASSPLKNIALSGEGNQIKIHGTLRKVIPFPIEMLCTVAPAADNRIQMHVAKLSVLKIPLKGLLGGLHVSLSDLFSPRGISGIQISGNDIFFDTQKLLPPPHIRGQLTGVRVINPDLEAIYGDPENAVTHVEQWRNFLKFSGGTLDFGKLTMHHVDIIMIDISNDAWFDLDLTNYQEQLVNGYTHMTSQAGLQIFMPDLDELPHKKTSQNITLEWLKNRNISPPPDVTSR